MPVIMVGGSPPGSEPTAVQPANLTLWYDAAYNTYSDQAATTPQTADAGSVRAWIDRISNYKVVDGGTGNYPTLETGEVNGRPTLRFGAVSAYLTAANGDTYLGAKNTSFLVWKPPASAQPQRGVFYFDGANSIWMIVNGTSGRVDGYNYDGSVDTVNLATTLDAWTITTLMNDGSNVLLGSSDTRTASLASVASGDNLKPGSNFFLRSVVGSYVQTDIAEYIHYNINLSEADRKAIEYRLAWKYGLTLPY